MSADNGDDNEWVLDSLVGFLKGPVWGLTIDAFIDNKSVVFEPMADSEAEEWAHEHRLLYDQYKTLVDRLLCGHMSDLGIGAEQFEEACVRADGQLTARVRQVLFEQIWAAEDFNVFVRFMTQRNLELQLQALRVLVNRFGRVYDSFVPLGADKDQYMSDESVLNDALRLSLEDGDDDTVGQTTVLAEERRLETERVKEQEKLSLAIQAVITHEEEEEDTVVEEPQEDESQKKKKEVVDRELLKTRESDEGVVTSAHDVKQRTEYLRQQRDKLLALKKQERDKQLVRIEAEQVMAKRPKSARAMRSTVGANTAEDESSCDQSLAFRRSLAARLKAEVIEQQKH